MKITIPALTLLFVSFASSSVSSETMESLLSNLNTKLEKRELHDNSVVKGSLRVRLCQYCHGKDGNSVKNDIPNLAQQNPVYLLKQFEYFRNGKRNNKVMNELANNLTADERVNIALYYASKKVKQNAESKLIKVGLKHRGETIYKKTCINCHGEKAYGDKDLPRIAGQKYEFIVKTLRAYKDKKGVRPNSPMVPVSSLLSADDILSIASYVTNMR